MNPVLAGDIQFNSIFPSASSVCFIRLNFVLPLCGLEVKDPGYRSRGLGFDSRRYQIFWEVVGLERDPLSLVSTIEELFGRKSSCSGLVIREYARRDPLLWPHGTLYPQKLALTSLTSGGCSVGIVRMRTEATEFFYLFIFTSFWMMVQIRNNFSPSLWHVLPLVLKLL
jgi:hypothetical protein